ncbi:glycosyltransferase family 4 protein [Pseudomonas sp. dw_358]|uniref:glycosyltransferase family 4 protein n=1 Tax=Pseudomonas sp. dw_358 TaxID=2720083 RepID=UPI001BD4A3C7|nr:glycosyltransferase family 4 protein [Pseudomonas sp. dw_358]
MNLLFINSLYPPHNGGAADLALQLVIERLQHRGHRVCVLATGPTSGLHLDRVKGIKVYRAGLLNSYWHFSQQRPTALARLGWNLRDRYNAGMGSFVAQVAEIEQTELVICHNLAGWSVAVWDAVARLGLPTVQVLHDMYLLCSSASLFKNQQRCRRQCSLCRHLRDGHAERSAQVDGVIGMNRFLLERLRDDGFFKGALSRVIYSTGAHGEDNVVRLPQGRLTDGEPLRFGYLGTLSEPKGVGWLIDQFQRLPLAATLHIAGRGQAHYERELRRQARDNPNIHFAGQQSAESFYAHIDVAVVPSVWDEPQVVGAVHACAQSVPVIASQRGGLPEIIHEGENGLLCEPDDADSLGRAMQRLVDEPALRQSLASQARASVAPLLDVERMVDSYQQFFLEVLLKRGVRQAITSVALPS